MPTTTSEAPRPARAFEPTTVEVLLAWQALEVASKQVRDAFAAKANLSPVDFQALVFIAGRDDMVPKDLGAILHVSTGAMTALIDRLENAGHVSRQAHPSDRRSTRLVLTQLGALTVAEAGALYVDVVDGVVPGERRDALVETFHAMATALSDRSTSPA